MAFPIPIPKLMKIKTLVLQDTYGVRSVIADVIDSSNYDVCQIADIDIMQLPTIVDRLQPDLILCQERFREVLFKMDKELPKALPFIFFGDTGQTAPVMHITERRVAYLTSPFGSGVLNAAVQLMLGVAVMH